MDITDIDLIRAIVKTGSISEASTLINQSQPTLSRKLSRLEDQLKVELFHRSPKGLTPTDIALRILSKAEPLDHRLREIERYVELTTQLETGKINLGVGPIIEQILLPAVLSRFLETTGDVTVSIVTENAVTLLQMFEASELDLIVGPFRAGDQKSKDMLALPMIKDDIVAIARKHHPIFKIKKIDKEALSQFPLVAPNTSVAAKQAKGGPQIPKPKIRSDNYDLLKKIVLKSDALCVGPRAIFKDEMDEGHLREVKFDLRITWESALIIRSETMLAPLARHLVSLFEEAVHHQKQ